MPLGAISLALARSDTHMDTLWGLFPTADEFLKHSSRSQDESQVHPVHSDMYRYGPLTHQQSTKTLDPT